MCHRASTFHKEGRIPPMQKIRRYRNTTARAPTQSTTETRHRGDSGGAHPSQHFGRTQRFEATTSLRSDQCTPIRKPQCSPRSWVTPTETLLHRQLALRQAQYTALNGEHKTPKGVSRTSRRCGETQHITHTDQGGEKPRHTHPCVSYVWVDKVAVVFPRKFHVYTFSSPKSPR